MAVDASFPQIILFPQRAAMPWPTTRGLRKLSGAEADLVRGAIGMMVDAHVSEWREGTDPWRYGVDWYDQWDVRQRLWLLDRVSSGLLGDETIESPAAIFDATVDAVFHEIIDLIQIEIEQGSASSNQLPQRQISWRESVIAAFAVQTNRAFRVAPESIDLSEWQTAVTRIADAVLGVRLYQRAEDFRDGNYAKTRRFLRDRGLPENYLTVIPPLRTVDQTQASIDRIQMRVFDAP